MAGRKKLTEVYFRYRTIRIPLSDLLKKEIRGLTWSEMDETGIFQICIYVYANTGGAISSFASLAPIIISEPYGIYSFAGPSVVRNAGMKLDDYYTSPGFIREKNGIGEIVFRPKIKSAVAKHLRSFYLYKNKKPFYRKWETKKL